MAILPNVMPPSRVLFVTSNLWGTDFLIVRALRQAGIGVAMLCPAQHPVRATRLDALFDLPFFGAARRLRAAVAAFRPTLLVPSDERALSMLHRLGRCGDAQDRRLVEDSLGPPESWAMMGSRRASMEAAAAAGVPVPRLLAETSQAGLERALPSLPDGLVLKADDTWGGNGVRICRTPADIRAAIAALKPPSLPRAVKRSVINGEVDLLAYRLARAEPVLSAQERIPGDRVGDLALFCRDGTTLALVCAERESGSEALGPSTVVRIDDRAPLAAAARDLVRRHRLSGFIGLDFIVDPHTNEARVIEINPRVTPLAAHRPAGGPSPAGAAAAALGAPAADRIDAAFRARVAYFPKAWLAHADDPRLEACAADIPSDEPQLVAALLAREQRRLGRRPFRRIGRTGSPARAPILPA